MSKHYEWMNEEQKKCHEFLAELFHGYHHLCGKVRPCGNDGIEFNCTNAGNHFATYDYDYLTRACIMAHDDCVRFAMEPSGPGMLKLMVHKRNTRTGRMDEKHPTIEQAIDFVRSKRTAQGAK